MHFKLNKKISRIILVILAVIAILSWTAVFVSSDNKLHIHFYNIGQGDAIYIRTPQGQDILIDGGPDATILTKLGHDMPFYDREIELVILTHPHADHITGLIDVLTRYKVDQILSTKAVSSSATFKEWEKIVQEKNISVKVAHTGQKIKLGQAKMSMLYPIQNLADKEVKDLNNRSIIFWLAYGKNSALFTGDAGMKVERELLNKKVYLKSDILKVGHHGSKTSTSEKFLEAVNPEYAIISVGKNSYGHPSSEVLERLKDIKLFRIDLDGDVECVMDGKEATCHKRRN